MAPIKIENKRKYNPDIYQRKSIRLKDYDYSQTGAYFVTICTNNRQCLFGKILDNGMILNEFGEIVWNEWFKSRAIREEIELYDDEFIVMPNHIHGIVWIIDKTEKSNEIIVGANGRSPLQSNERVHSRCMIPKSLSSFVAGFKSSVTKQINQLRNTPHLPVWQRNYYEHIIRNDNELDEIREYIINNPSQWELDIENPERKNKTNEEFKRFLLNFRDLQKKKLKHEQNQ